MPTVACFKRQGVTLSHDLLFVALRQIVPAAYRTDDVPLVPGSIHYLPHDVPNHYLATDVYLEMFGTLTPDRKVSGVPAKPIKAALNRLFPGITFSMDRLLHHAEYVTDNPDDPPFSGDMTMAAAMSRAKMDIARLRRPGWTIEDVIGCT